MVYRAFILTVIIILGNGCVFKSEGIITEMKRFHYSQLFLNLPQHTELPRWGGAANGPQTGEWGWGRLGLPGGAQSSALGPLQALFSMSGPQEREFVFH